MKKLLFLTLVSVFLSAMDKKPELKKKPSQEDLEVAIHKIDDLADKVEQSRKCCPLSRAQTTVLTSIASSAITAAVTIASLYSHCDAKSGTNSTAPF